MNTGVKMKPKIPQALLAVVADHVGTVESHASLENLLTYAGCPGDPPSGNRQVKALAWLRVANSDPRIDPLAVIGKVIETYMDKVLDPKDWDYESLTVFRRKVNETLANANLHYRSGGLIIGALAAPTRTLQQFIENRDMKAISEEFERASSKAEHEPREAVSAAANILESLCKHYIQDRGLTMPTKQVLGDLWNVVRKDLGFDPGQVADDDLRLILTGLIQVVHGLAAFRTHASSAHGAGPKAYRLSPRHSRLAVHAAHTATLFILESWDRKRGVSA